MTPVKTKGNKDNNGKKAYKRYHIHLYSKDQNLNDHNTKATNTLISHAAERERIHEAIDIHKHNPRNKSYKQ